MTMLRRPTSALSLLLLPLAALAAQAPALSVHDIFGTHRYATDLQSVEWDARMPFFTTIVSDDSGRTDLVRVDGNTGARAVLVPGASLVPPGGTKPIAIESYQFSADGSKLLIFTNSIPVWRQNTKGTFYVWDLDAKRLSPVSVRPGYQQFAKFSPDARQVAFVRDNNLYVTDLASGAERALTADGDANVINGTSDWVYEEELNLRDAFRWSSDGRRIAFWRLDQSPIKPFYLQNLDSLYPQQLPVRYPKPGTPNSQVRIGVVDLTTNATSWIDLGTNPDIYVAELGFAGSDSVWLTRLNRHQDSLTLLMASVTSGRGRVVMTDVDSAWVDANVPTWINGGSQFLFTSERDGYDQVYLFNRDGSLVRRVTPGGWDVTATFAVDEKAKVIYVTGAIDNPMTRPLLRIGLDGKNLVRLTTGAGTHSASFSADRSLYVDQFSGAGAAPVQTVRRANGVLVRNLSDNRVLTARLDSLGLSKPEFLQIPGADGTMLNAWMIKPPHFEPAHRYPVVMVVYGGPGSQTVLDAWGARNYLWQQLLAQNGYIVASVDNRGTGQRGRAFTKATYLHLGRLESDDQIAAARWLGQQPYVDPSRIGIWGWSYGGYMSSLSMFRGEGVFHAAVVVAPVTDWHLYDTIYTERYMRTPQENPEGYRESAPLNYADKLRDDGRLLLVHGTGDDNVHFQNSSQLVQRLIRANRQFDMRIYPNRTHSISGANTSENLYGLFTQWLKQNL